MDEEDFDRRERAALKSEMLHREQVREFELRKAKADAEAADLVLLSTKLGLARAFGSKELKERLEKQMREALETGGIVQSMKGNA